MKRKYIIYIPACVLALLVIQACKKNFLDRQPMGSLNETNLANSVGVEGLLIGAYAKLGGSQNWGSAPSNWVFGSVIADEAYKGSTPSDQPDINPLESWAYNTNNPYLNEKWTNNYNGIGRANETLRMLAKATDVSADNRKRIAGEARFLRALYHMDMKRIFGNIPFVDENITVSANNTNVTNIEGSGYVNAWPQIEADFKFAMDNLGDAGFQNQAGRANKWAAVAFLAKALISQGKYAEAKPLFDQVIASGKTAKGETYRLVNYFSNFNPAQDNNPESIFAYQASVNDGSATNGNYGDNLNFPNSGGPGGCCGFFNPSITLANAFKTDANGLPLLDTYNSGANVGAPTGAYAGTVDPRFDLTVGRPGVPYLDWGPHPGATWIRDPAINGWFSPRKTAFAKSQQGSLSSNETAFWGPTQMSARNVVLMRYADLLLMAAETEVQAGDPSKALNYVNQVRARAADPKGWVYMSGDYDAATAMYKTQTTPAGNYNVKPYPAGAFADKAFALKAVMHERMIELGQEGHRFFDLQRWNRITPGIMATILNAYAATERNRPGFFSINPTATFTANKNEILPLPQGQIDQANSYG
ncbi:MAG: RagB/SusD family nutrient uptake outer membrane protein, partial [Bacteroidota bacterium]|nr:RagB/SusD family nutrient uptake outer membrane protein [Bacteroidota bacterium]